MMLRNFLLTAAALPALALAGCGGGTPNRGLESVHQPVVQQQDYAFDVPAGPGGLAPGEGARLGGWFEALRLGFGDRVSVDDTHGYGAGARADVARQAAQFGLILDETAPVTATPVATGAVRVIVTRSTASVPGCPDFSRYKGTNFDNHTTSNYGCATNSNLAAMIANPTDLVRGATSTEVYDPQLGARAINTYRRAAPSGGSSGGGAGGGQSTGGK